MAKKRSLIPYIILAILCVCIAAGVLLKLFVFGTNESSDDAEYSYEERQTIDTINHLTVSRVESAVVQFQTNHKARRDNLPIIESDTERTNGVGEREIDIFYKDAFGNDFPDYNGDQYTIIFSKTLDTSIIKDKINEIAVFLHAKCDSDGNLVAGEIRNFAVVTLQFTSKKYSCLSD